MTATTEYGFEIIPHPPYSSNMAPFDFYMFPKLKFHLRCTHYESNEGAIEAVNEYLGTYSEGIRKLEQRWAKRIALKGNGMKSNGQIFIPGSPKYKGPRTVFISHP